MSHDNPHDAPWVGGQIEPDGPSFAAMKNRSLLDSMEQAGLQWPSSCRAGSCRTCLSRLLHGEVRYEMAWPGLTPEEKAEGCVLPCVAYPVTDVSLKDPFSD